MACRLVMLFFAVVCLVGCSRPATPPPPETAMPEPVAPSMFTLAAEVQAQAPNMQRDFDAVLPYLSDRFLVKPEFVFIDETPENIHYGRISTMVVWLQFFHVSYYRGEELIWSGSVLLSEGHSVGLAAKRGYQWNLDATPSGGTRLTFRAGTQDWSYTFAPAKSGDVMVGLGEERVYMVHHHILRSQLIGKPDRKLPQPQAAETQAP